MRVTLAFVLLALPCAACFDEPPSSDAGDADEGGSSGSSGASTTATSTMTGTTDATSTTATTTATSSSTSAATEEGSSTDATTEVDPDSSTGPAQETVVLDVAASACDATWTNDQGNLVDCPTPRFADRMMMVPNPQWSSGHVFRATDETIQLEESMELFGAGAIATHPRFDAEGWITGRFDADSYPDGATFRARVACVQAGSCEAVVYVGLAPDPSSAPAWLDDWDVSAVAHPEGRDIEVALDAGNGPVELVIAVESGVQSGSDTIAWIAPRVVTPG